MLEKLKRKFKEIKVEGNRKGVSAMMCTEPHPELLPETYYTKSELEAMYMGTESKARKRYQRQGSYQRRESYGQR